MTSIDGRIKDSDGKSVKAGDVVCFSFGIPPVYVEAPIILLNDRLYASTPNHNPTKCLLSTLKKHVGWFSKLEEKSS